MMELNIEKRQKPERLRLVNDHLHTTVTCLQWDATGEKLFSGDLLGKVVVSVIPSSKVSCHGNLPVYSGTRRGKTLLRGPTRHKSSLDHYYPIID